MANVFTWAPDFGAQGNYKPNIHVAAMGDGYEQRTQFGLNANPAGWSLQFTKRTDAEAAAIYGFLTSMGALQSFQWTPPGESFALTFVCRQFTKAPVNGNGVDAATGRAKYLWDISAQFDQVFEP